MDQNTDRRFFITGMLAALSSSTCLADVIRLCPGDTSISNIASPLTIDTHAHFFNGSDLQIREFLAQNMVEPGSELFPLVRKMSGILELLAWNTAPSAPEERAAMASYAARLHDCTGNTQLRKVAASMHQEGYLNGRRELQRAANTLQRSPGAKEVLGPARTGNAGLGAAIAALPESWEEFEETHPSVPAVLKTQPTFSGYLRFLLHHFNYRHVNAIEYLATYSNAQERKVDLVVANLVDYDWWLSRGRSTRTPLRDQIELMSDLSVLLGGRVHGFVAFCPFRELMTLDVGGIGDSMRMVRMAVEQHGFLGVKLYPPMGFAAYGNTGKTVWRNKPTLNSVADSPDFGARLDRALHRLYTYCEKNDVPIMAHTNRSNGPYPEFRALADSEYWKIALEKFPGLRVSFGHFGDSNPDDHSGERTLPFLKLMTNGEETWGRNTFADSGFFAGALVDRQTMTNVLRTLYRAENGIISERLMYGTDWTMILTQKSVRTYLADFIEIMRRLEDAEAGANVRQTSLANAFFGRNAVEFLGLRRGRGNRERLERFYARRGISEPDWLRKVGNT